MAKKNHNEILPTIGGVFSLFVVLLYCLNMLFPLNIRLGALLQPSLWLILGVCLMSTRKLWILVVGLLPLTIVVMQQSFGALPLTDVNLFVRSLICKWMPGIGFGALFILALLTATHVSVGFRRSIWWLPILLILPSCILQHGSTLPWAQFGAIASIALWLKPAGR